MVAKIQEILSSIRFWQMLAAFVVYTLATEGAIDPVWGETIAKILGVSVGIGSIDSFAKKLNGK